MKNIIYCFSGTGNSLRAAVKIAEEIGGAEIISVRCNPEEASAQNAAVVRFVSPVYEWDMPGTMKDFVRKLKINPNAYVFMVATYIAIHGKCFKTMEHLLSKKGLHLHYGRALRCVASQCTAYPHMSVITRKLYSTLMTPYMEAVDDIQGFIEVREEENSGEDFPTND